MDQNSEIPPPLSPEHRRLVPPKMPTAYKGHERFFRFINDLDEFSKRKLLKGAFVLGMALLSLPFFSEPPRQISHPQTVHVATEQQTILPMEPEQIGFVEDITKQAEKFKEDKERIANTLRWINMVELVTQDSRLKIPESMGKFWQNRMLEIIFVESGGNPQADPANMIKDQKLREAVQKTSAKGLTQLKPQTASEVATQYRIPSYNLENAWDNVFLGLAYQLELSKRYDLDLSAWAHHLGPGNMDQALEAYLIQVLKLPLKEVQSIFQTPNNDLILLEYIKRYQITPDKLLESPAVTGKLKQIGAFEDDTQYYWPRIQAAGLAMGVSSTG